MLKHRQEGLISLQGFIVTALLGGIFLLWAALIEATGLIQFASETNIKLYFLGVIGGTLISARSYHTIPKDFYIFG